MKHSTYKLLVLMLSLVILVGGAMLLYRNLSPQVDLGEPVPTEQAADLAPDFTVTDADGNPVKLSDFLGKPVVVNFWASWCGPCKQEMPHFQTAYEQYGEDVVFLMVNMSAAFGDTPSDANQVLEDGGYSFPVYYDTNAECAYGYGVTGIPMTFFIRRDGSIASAKTGMIAEADLQRRIQLIAD